MRNIERLLTVLCFGGSVLAGGAHLPQWLLVTPLCFAGLMVAEDYAVRQQIGIRTWPSEGYARFLFGTNLFRAVRNTLIGTGIFIAAAGATSLLQG
jgi:hypothetical protein